MARARTRLALPLVTASLALVLLSARAAAQEAKTFIEQGKQHYRDRRFVDAVQEFRVARFMTLHDPPVHEETLARLVLAEEAAGMKAERDQTLQRFIEAEDKFEAF